MFFHFIKHRRIFYVFSGLLMAGAILSVVMFGLNLGIEFTGGALIEVEFKNTAPALGDIRQELVELEDFDFVLQKIGERGLAIKTQSTDEQIKDLVLEKLSELGELEAGSESFQLIGSVIGKELKKKTNIVIILSLLAILAYIALSFRRIARPVKSYLFGLSSLLALIHDVMIPLGVFALLGKLAGAEITIPIITAFLTVFGYSINDSVVVFDRIRENLLKLSIVDFDLIIEQSLNESLKRSLHTSLTTLFALLAIFFLGGASLRFFSLALILGILSGTYSSLFLASPLLVSYLKFKERKYRQ